MEQNTTPTEGTQTLSESTESAPKVVRMPDLSKETLRASVIIGSKATVVAELEKYFGSEPYYRLDPQVSFADQVERLVTNSKYRNSHYVYGMVSYGRRMPESELDEEMKAFPPAVREYRVQRVEIHR